MSRSEDVEVETVLTGGCRGCVARLDAAGADGEEIKIIYWVNLESADRQRHFLYR